MSHPFDATLKDPSREHPADFLALSDGPSRPLNIDLSAVAASFNPALRSRTSSAFLVGNTAWAVGTRAQGTHDLRPQGMIRHKNERPSSVSSPAGAALPMLPLLAIMSGSPFFPSS